MTTALPSLDWGDLITEQLRWHWNHHLRPRLDGLGDDEYRWEPVGGCWNLRPRAQSTAQLQAGEGDLVLEFAMPEPDPPPVTTIAWRIGHLLVGVLGSRNATHFGGPPVDYRTMVWPATADAALAALDAAHDHWAGAVAALGPDDLARPIGPAEGPFAELPMAALVLHINRELIHHGAEILTLRDLYRSGAPGSAPTGAGS